jgi:2-dehydropantoate 2-reductase
MRVTVAGAGAVGCVLAAAVARSGHDTSVIARGETLRAIQTRGVGLAEAGGTSFARVAADGAARFGVQDVIFVCTKAQDLAAMAEMVQPLIGERTIVIPMVNGVPFWFFAALGRETDVVRAVDPDGALGTLLPLAKIVGAVVSVSASSPEPGVSAVCGSPFVTLGEPAGGSSARLERLAGLLPGGGVELRVADDLRVPLWTKLVVNVATNLLSVVTGTTIGEMVDSAALRAVIGQTVEEVRALAASFGVVPAIDTARLMGMAAGMGPLKTSTLQDYERGRPLEIGAIGDAVLELAEMQGVAMPVTRTLVATAGFLGEARCLRKVTEA